MEGRVLQSSGYETHFAHTKTRKEDDSQALWGSWIGLTSHKTTGKTEGSMSTFQGLIGRCFLVMIFMKQSSIKATGKPTHVALMKPSSVL